MSRAEPAGIAVIIAAHDAERTVGRAIRSALREREVVEVVVVDDASNDTTCAAARLADDGSGRLRIIVSARNGGPAAARNLALERCRAPFVAVLDADDLFLPGRFHDMGFIGGTMAADCDAVADNIVFAQEAAIGEAERTCRLANDGAATLLDLETLIRGNISRPGQPRGELGFLKPVLRREFLERCGLRYNPELRLGEDFEFYVRLIAAGGKFRIARACGYLAVERHNSLSAVHSAGDLAALAAADQELIATLGLSAAERSALLSHRAHVLKKCDHRRFLDARRERGLRAAFGELAGHPGRLGNVLRAVAADKLRALKGAPSPPNRPRLLLQAGQP